VQGSAGLPKGERVKRRLHMRLAEPTNPAHVTVSSRIMKRVFQQPARVSSRSWCAAFTWNLYGLKSSQLWRNGGAT